MKYLIESMKKYKITWSLAVFFMVVFCAGIAHGHSHYGNSNVSVNPTSTYPGGTITVHFHYTIWHAGHYGINDPWEIRLDGTPGVRDGILLASGSVYHASPGGGGDRRRHMMLKET